MGTPMWTDRDGDLGYNRSFIGIKEDLRYNLVQKGGYKMEKKLYERPMMEIVQFAAQENLAANDGEDNSAAWPWSLNEVE